MGLYEALARPLLFALDPESAHHLGLAAVARGLVSSPAPSVHERRVFGVDFPNPVGLAAGFDKNGVALAHWHRLGFGFVEIGTVTRHPQPGNPRPRLFRLQAERALINRLGFNNDGADAMAKTIEGVRAGIPVGINIGKSKVTPLEEAATDYAYSFRLLAPFADYVVVNVSSPNTPGLRVLQDRDALTRILMALKEIDQGKPLFVKVAPDLALGQLDDVVDVVQTLGLTGIVATNTTVDRSMLPRDPALEGGLSGAPLRTLSDTALEHLAAIKDDRTLLIGVGGVMGPEDARRKLELGASLVQVYTGFVYGGPGFAASLVAGLST
ncbi:MAG: quinone-dependent dihydroorotate dehydrogenase [Fimbriimonadaceae bacterium]|nr:quinone-dependent dihydroorotate dehydrogenase [Fimbriimonadaceae bacterium]QYK58183.1 MAG: quinone-dependent dihydroorotate dehydrogenase [Fimbriimonadaceae bacterium]